MTVLHHLQDAVDANEHSWGKVETGRFIITMLQPIPTRSDFSSKHGSVQFLALSRNQRNMFQNREEIKINAIRPLSVLQKQIMNSVSNIALTPLEEVCYLQKGVYFQGNYFLRYSGNILYYWCKVCLLYTSRCV